MMSKYVRVTKGVVDKGLLVPLNKVQENIKSSEQDYYVSTYHYDEKDYQTYVKNNKSVKGIVNLKTNKIWFDFDHDTNPELAQKDAIVVVQRLQEEGFPEEAIDIYFSGKKGYTVEVLVDKELNRRQVEYLAIEKYGKGLPTLDLSMYDYSQIFRVPNTKHPKSGLYKTQLSVEQLNKLSVEEIKSLAKSLKPIAEKVPVEVPEEVLAVPEPEKPKPTPKATSIDLNTRPMHWKDYKWALLNAHMVEANERHEALMILAATCRGMGYDEAMTEALCLSFDEKFQANTGKPPVEDLQSNIIPSIFSENWNGGQYSYKNNKWLQKYCTRIGIDTPQDESVVTVYDVKDHYIDFVKNIEQNTIKTGIWELDQNVPITVGMNLGLVGAASSGKTALAVKILENTSKAGIISVFASLDMHRNRLLEKLLYRVSGLSREELYKRIKENRADDLFALLKEKYGNVYFYDRSAPSVADIKEYVKRVEKDTGQKVKLVMIDYFERVNGEKSDETAASKEVSGQIQDLINDLNVAVITLVQPNKFALSGGPDSPIKSYTAIKGSSFLYQSFRSIIAIWRPFFTPTTKDKDKYMQMAVLKNDLGELDVFNFAWNGKRGEIESLVDDTELNNWLAEKENAKNKEGSSDGNW